MGNGIIYKALSGFFYVETGRSSIKCKARGRFKLENITPLVGDNVEFTPTEPGCGIVVKINPRKNEFIRPPIANIDKLVIVSSGAIPATDTFLIDKITVIAIKNNSEPVICINKYDLDCADELYEIYNKSGFKTVRVSARTGYGIMELIDTISKSCCAFTGNSGVGKSSILNAVDSSLNISVGNLSKKLGRGKHTTRHVELYKLQCETLVADTPGFSAFDLDYIAPCNEIQFLFPDFKQYLGKCRYTDCAHINEPECFVQTALLNGLIQKSRHASYMKLYDQASKYKHWAK